MDVSKLHLFRQGPVIRSLLRTAGSAVGGRGGNATRGAVPVPGPVFDQTLKPRNPRLVADYIRHVGGDPAWYRGALPPHFFPQWGFPVLARTLHGMPYDMSRILNGGCRMEIVRPIPVGSSLVLSAQLIEVDDNGNRAILKQKIVSGTGEHPESLIAYVNAIVPRKRSGGPRKERPRVPEDAREVDRWRLSKNAGLEFALVTGDFNPVHWIPRYARLAGFSNTILHGFATMARTIESLNRSMWLGRPGRLAAFECRFIRPLVFPGQAKVFADGDRVFVGDAPGGPVYLAGGFTTREE